jgi:hypothetical protein
MIKMMIGLLAAMVFVLAVQAQAAEEIWWENATSVVDGGVLGRSDHTLFLNLGLEPGIYDRRRYQSGNAEDSFQEQHGA